MLRRHGHRSPTANGSAMRCPTGAPAVWRGDRRARPGRSTPGRSSSGSLICATASADQAATSPRRSSPPSARPGNTGHAGGSARRALARLPFALVDLGARPGDRSPVVRRDGQARQRRACRRPAARAAGPVVAGRSTAPLGWRPAPQRERAVVVRTDGDHQPRGARRLAGALRHHGSTPLERARDGPCSAPTACSCRRPPTTRVGAATSGRRSTSRSRPDPGWPRCCTPSGDTRVTRRCSTRYSDRSCTIWPNRCSPSCANTTTAVSTCPTATRPS